MEDFCHLSRLRNPLSCSSKWDAEDLLPLSHLGAPFWMLGYLESRLEFWRAKREHSWPVWW